MKKLKIKYLIFPLFLSLFIYLLFIFFQPEEKVDDLFNQLNASWVDYEDLTQHLGPEPKAYFFCTETQANCIYTNNEILDDLTQDANTERFTQIYFVDMTKLSNEILPSALKSSLGFSHYPAFALLSIQQKTIQIHSVYEWSDDAVFTMYGLKSWMVANQLWLAEYTN